MTNSESGRNRTLNTASDSSLFRFAKPYFDYIGKGKIYSLFYIAMAILNLLIPFSVIYIVIESGFLQRSGAKVVVGFIFSLIVIFFASWIGFQLWWCRKSGIRKVEAAEFIATPVISDLIQTSGEWLGTYIAITSAGIGLIAVIFLGHSTGSAFSPFNFNFLEYAPLMIIGGPVAGFFIILISRFFAEQVKIFTSIANNTREIARNSKK